MVPWQSLAARQTQASAILLTSDSTIESLPTPGSSSSLVTDGEKPGTISGIQIPTITVTSSSSSASVSTTPTARPSSSDNQLALPVPVIIAIAVGSFLFLAILLVLFMCLRNRGANSKARQKRDKTWRTLAERDREREKSFAVGFEKRPSFAPLRVSLPDVAIPNPFATIKDAYTSPTEEIQRPSSIGAKIYLGSTNNARTTQVYSTARTGAQRHVSLSTPTILADPFSTPTGTPTDEFQAPLARDTSRSNYSGLAADSTHFTARGPSPAQLPRPPPSAVVLPSKSHARRSQNSVISVSTAALTRPAPEAISPITRQTPHPPSTMSSRPAFQAILSALEPRSLEEEPPSPGSAYSYATTAAITALGTPRSSMARTSLPPPQPTLPPSAEMPVADPNLPRSTPLLLRSVSREAISLSSRPLGLAEATNPTSRPPIHSTVSSRSHSSAPSVAQSQRGLQPDFPNVLRAGWSRDSAKSSDGSFYSNFSTPRASFESGDSEATIRMPRR